MTSDQVKYIENLVDNAILELSNAEDEDEFKELYLDDYDIEDETDAYYTLRLSSQGEFMGRGTNLFLNRCYIGRSSVHGHGVFAKEKILEGEIITFYPAHALFYPEDKTIILSCELEQDMKVDNEDISQYCLKLETKTIIGNRKIYEDPTFLGHKINDGSFNVSKRSLYDETRENCFFQEYEYVCYVLACKNIEKDEELFASYGLGYWFDNLEVKHIIERSPTKEKSFSFIVIQCGEPIIVFYCEIMEFFNSENYMFLFSGEHKKILRINDLYVMDQVPQHYITDCLDKLTHKYNVFTTLQKLFPLLQECGWIKN